MRWMRGNSTHGKAKTCPCCRPPSAWRPAAAGALQASFVQDHNSESSDWQLGTPPGMRKIPGKTELNTGSPHPRGLNFPIQGHGIPSSTSQRKIRSPKCPLPPAPDTPLLPRPTPPTPPAKERLQVSLLAHAALPPPVSPLTGLRVGQAPILHDDLAVTAGEWWHSAIPTFTVTYLSLWIHPVCQAGRNSITVRVTKLSPECHQ